MSAVDQLTESPTADASSGNPLDLLPMRQLVVFVVRAHQRPLTELADLLGLSRDTVHLDSLCGLSRTARGALVLLEEREEARRGERIEVDLGGLDTGRRERIGHRVRDRGGCSDGPAFRHPLHATRRVRRRRLEVSDDERRHTARDWEGVVHERSRQQLSVLVVDEFFREHRPETLHGGAHHLPVQRH